jgi:hypothetical protein
LEKKISSPPHVLAQTREENEEEREEEDEEQLPLTASLEISSSNARPVSLHSSKSFAIVGIIARSLFFMFVIVFAFKRVF